MPETKEDAANTPPVRRRARLNTIAGCRREIARIYREGGHPHFGKLSVMEVSKLTHVLWTCARLIQDSDLEERLTRLEASMADSK